MAFRTEKNIEKIIEKGIKLLILVLFASCNYNANHSEISRDEDTTKVEITNDDAYLYSTIRISTIIVDQKYKDFFRILYAKPGNKQLMIEIINDASTLMKTHGIPKKDKLEIKYFNNGNTFVDVLYDLPEEISITFSFNKEIGPNHLLDLSVHRPIDLEEVYKVFPKLRENSEVNSATKATRKNDTLISDN